MQIGRNSRYFIFKQHIWNPKYGIVAAKNEYFQNPCTGILNTIPY